MKTLPFYLSTNFLEAIKKIAIFAENLLPMKLPQFLLTKTHADALEVLHETRAGVYWQVRTFNTYEEATAYADSCSVATASNKYPFVLERLACLSDTKPQRLEKITYIALKWYAGHWFNRKPSQGVEPTLLLQQIVAQRNWYQGKMERRAAAAYKAKVLAGALKLDKVCELLQLLGYSEQRSALWAKNE